MASKVFNGLMSIVFEYDTQKIVHIKSKKVGVINRFLQLVIIGYVIGYAIVFQKGYQEFDNVQGAVTTKLKGVAKTSNLTPPASERIWDVSDYVVPPQENNAFFVITNLIITEDQSLGYCEEDNGVPGANCTDSNICMEGVPLMAGDGYMTGACNASTRYPGLKSCIVQAWCPTEDGRLSDTLKRNPPALQEAQNFTVFIKNNIEFPKFSVKRRNVPSYANASYLGACRFDFGDNKLCPIFELKTIISGAGTWNFSDIATKGGVIQILIDWNCNLDHSVEDCIPEYSFRRLDSPQDILSPGYNFRYAHYYRDENKTEFRTLYKAYGIKFIVTLQGRAGKFHVVPLLLNIGSGLALLSIATIVCDIVVLYVLKAKGLYRDKKYLQVEGDDAYKVVINKSCIDMVLTSYKTLTVLRNNFCDQCGPRYGKEWQRELSQFAWKPRSIQYLVGTFVLLHALSVHVGQFRILQSAWNQACLTLPNLIFSIFDLVQ